jgi:DNA-binding Lrp family transcriptional regulator
MNKENQTVLRKRFDVCGAFVVIDVELGSEDQVLEDMKTVEGVEDAYLTYGSHDLIIKIKADSIEELKEMVAHRFRAIKNVKSTLSLILIDETEKKAKRHDSALFPHMLT